MTATPDPLPSPGSSLLFLLPISSRPPQDSGGEDSGAMLGLSRFASPLVLVDPSSQNGNVIPLERLDVQGELEQIRQAVHGLAGRTDLTVSVHVATPDTLRMLLTTGGVEFLHISCHGHPDALALEDGRGSAQLLSADSIHQLVRSVMPAESTPGGQGSGCRGLRLIFLSSCWSNKVASALVDAGVPHVVCVKAGHRVKDLASRQFASAFYLALASGHSVERAFHVAKAAVLTLSGHESESEKFLLLPADEKENTPQQGGDNAAAEGGSTEKGGVSLDHAHGEVLWPLSPSCSLPTATPLVPPFPASAAAGARRPRRRHFSKRSLQAQTVPAISDFGRGAGDCTHQKGGRRGQLKRARRGSSGAALMPVLPRHGSEHVGCVPRQTSEGPSRCPVMGLATGLKSTLSAALPSQLMGVRGESEGKDERTLEGEDGRLMEGRLRAPSWCEAESSSSSLSRAFEAHTQAEGVTPHPCPEGMSQPFSLQTGTSVRRAGRGGGVMRSVTDSPSFFPPPPAGREPVPYGARTHRYDCAESAAVARVTARYMASSSSESASCSSSDFSGSSPSSGSVEGRFWSSDEESGSRRAHRGIMGGHKRHHGFPALPEHSATLPCLRQSKQHSSGFLSSSGHWVPSHAELLPLEVPLAGLVPCVAPEEKGKGKGGEESAVSVHRRVAAISHGTTAVASAGLMSDESESETGHGSSGTPQLPLRGVRERGAEEGGGEVSVGGVGFWGRVSHTLQSIAIAWASLAPLDPGPEGCLAGAVPSEASSGDSPKSSVEVPSSPESASRPEGRMTRGARQQYLPPDTRLKEREDSASPSPAVIGRRHTRVAVEEAVRDVPSDSVQHDPHCPPPQGCVRGGVRRRGHGVPVPPRGGRVSLATCWFRCFESRHGKVQGDGDRRIGRKEKGGTERKKKGEKKSGGSRSRFGWTCVLDGWSIWGLKLNRSWGGGGGGGGGGGKGRARRFGGSRLREREREALIGAQTQQHPPHEEMPARFPVSFTGKRQKERIEREQKRSSTALGGRRGGSSSSARGPSCSAERDSVVRGGRRQERKETAEMGTQTDDPPSGCCLCSSAPTPNATLYRYGADTSSHPASPPSMPPPPPQMMHRDHPPGGIGMLPLPLSNLPPAPHAHRTETSTTRDETTTSRSQPRRAETLPAPPMQHHPEHHVHPPLRMTVSVHANNPKNSESSGSLTKQSPLPPLPVHPSAEIPSSQRDRTTSHSVPKKTDETAPAAAASVASAADRALPVLLGRLSTLRAGDSEFRLGWHVVPEASEDFVGRHLDVWALLRLVHSRKVVILSGVRGVGKTAVVEEVARYCAMRGDALFPGGILFLRLSDQLQRLHEDARRQKEAGREVDTFRDEVFLFCRSLAEALGIPVSVVDGRRSLEPAGSSSSSNSSSSSAPMLPPWWDLVERRMHERVVEKGRSLMVLDGGAEGGAWRGGGGETLAALLMGRGTTRLVGEMGSAASAAASVQGGGRERRLSATGLRGLHILITGKMGGEGASQLEVEKEKEGASLLWGGRFKFCAMHLKPLSDEASAELFLRRMSRPLRLCDFLPDPEKEKERADANASSEAPLYSAVFKQARPGDLHQAPLDRESAVRLLLSDDDWLRLHGGVPGKILDLAGEASQGGVTLFELLRQKTQLEDHSR
uniref:CHAT domain-containing protein n=1 Tax=Chromera velia CCMP2878 TaxID=1169474 RepID=A0A0K6S870_9ALVE|eukprot:Cvel_5337.t2-p1 / transcript=Cvel_5337.t2 / gene=Cvel_5337 / organism=Chromera_velia_CCMP2878 / gene_product=hypothetical protein / transcript_product=hypothetical protein / location=Cvel_scaffold247:60518-80535(+) / protein_length=1649 / sequence_SO=supercontig / SO=protein_coding / is_pseudo=false